MTRLQRLRWLEEQAGWLLGIVLSVVLVVLLLPLVPALRLMAMLGERFDRWLDE